ncbi:MAG: hypothetical protein EBZ67_14240, partial [Chitinophagia bacterium]|nr:hypothetical protein [Chitinophagia bacterium]
MQVAYTGILISGNIATNDLLGTGATFGPARRDLSNPSDLLPVLTTGGSYTFRAQVPGVYRFEVPVCPQGTTTNCPAYRLEIRVQTPYGLSNPPMANPDRATTKQGQAVVLKTLANDGEGTLGRSLAPGSVRVTTALNPSTQGTTSVNPSTGDIRFVPATGFSGSLRYTYEVCDGQLPNAKCDTGFQEIWVLGTGSPNTTFGTDDYRMAFSGSTVRGNVLLNDVDAEGDIPVATTIDTTITGVGRVVLSANGDYSFQATPGFQGTLSLPYMACSTSGGTARCGRNTLYVLVTPSPVTLTDDRTVCHTATNPAITLPAGIPGYAYSWTNNKPSIGLAA